MTDKKVLMIVSVVSIVVGFIICAAGVLLGIIPIAAGVYLYLSARKNPKETPTKLVPKLVITPTQTENQTIFRIYTSRDKEKNIKQLREHFIALDTETTGLSWENDRIISIAAIHYINGQAADRFYSLINPMRHISESASQINGITNADVRTAPPENVVMQEFYKFIGDAAVGKTLLVAYNSNFDMQFIKRAFQRCGLSGNARHFDVLWYARKQIYGLKNYKQVTVAKHLGVGAENAHNAAADTSMCAEILLKLLEKVDG